MQQPEAMDLSGEMCIRPAVIADASSISTLILGLADRFILPEFSVTGRRRFLAAHTPLSIADLMITRVRYLVAEAGGVVVGVIGMRDGSHVHHLFVAERAQGRGLARRLWEQARVRCGAAAGHAAYTVNAATGAVPVYRRFGFIATASVQEQDGVHFVPMRLEQVAGRSEPVRHGA